MKCPKVLTMLKQIRDTDEMVASMPSDDPLRNPLTKQLRGTKLQLSELFVPSQRRGNGLRPTFGEVFAEELGRVRRAQEKMAASISTSAGGGSGGGGGRKGGGTKKNIQRGMAARERTKKYNEELKQRRNGGSVGEGSGSSGREKITATKRKGRTAGGPKPWQTPRANKNSGETGGFEFVGVSDNNSTTTTAGGSRTSDQAWFDEGGFGLPPVTLREDATAIVVQVVAARGLYGVPRAPDPEPGMRDPFVSIEMSFDGDTILHQKTSIKTAVKRSTLNPKWEQSLGMALLSDSEQKFKFQLVVRVEDNDRFNKQIFLGCVM